MVPRLFCAVIALIATTTVLFFLGAPVHAGPRTKTGRPAAPYQKLKPFEDLSLQDDASELYDKAVSAFSRQNYYEAEKLFKKVLSLTPGNTDAIYNLGAIAEWHNDLSRALQYYSQALSLKPNDHDFAKAVSEVQLKMQIEAKSRENKRQANMVDAGERAKIAFSRGDYYEAASQLNQLVQTLPNEPKVHFALGQSLRALKVYEWASYHLKMAIYLAPTDDTYRQALADLDQDIKLAQQQALNNSARIASAHLYPLSGGEVAATGGEL